MKTIVVNIKSGKPGIYIGRAGKNSTGYFGNPHPIGYCYQCKRNHTRDECIAAYKKDFLQRIQNDTEFRKRILELKGKTLICFCFPLACHGNVIAEYLDKEVM